MITHAASPKTLYCFIEPPLRMVLFLSFNVLALSLELGHLNNLAGLAGLICSEG
jgi:hypothetical protein